MGGGAMHHLRSSMQDVCRRRSLDDELAAHHAHAAGPGELPLTLRGELDGRGESVVVTRHRPEPPAHRPRPAARRPPRTAERPACPYPWGYLTAWPHLYTLGGMRQKAGAPLRILNEAFVPDERKAEIRARLNRMKGQLDGVERMLDQDRPCLEILTQLSAAQEALRGVGRVMARNYFERCASAAIKAGREREVYDELMEIVFKLSR